MLTLPDIGLPCRVKAVYSWGGEEEDDLGFIEGDLIDVDSFGDGNWWHGRLKRNKMVGNFPSNYVKLLDPPGSSASASVSSKPSHAASKKPPLKQETAGKRSKESSLSPNASSLDISGAPAANLSASNISNISDASFVRSPASPLSHSVSVQSLDHANNTVATIDQSLASAVNASQNNSFSLSPSDIEQQIQQLRQLQQLQILQSEIQKKNQIAHSLSTPQNLNLLVSQLNEFYAAKNKESAARTAAATTTQLLNNNLKSRSANKSGLPHSQSFSHFSHSPSANYVNKDILPPELTNPAPTSGKDYQQMQPGRGLPHSVSTPLNGLQKPMVAGFSNDIREFSNTSTLKPSHFDSDSHSISSDTNSATLGELDAPPPPPPVHRIPVKLSYSPTTTANNIQEQDLQHLLNKNLNLCAGRVDANKMTASGSNNLSAKPFYQNLQNSNNTSFIVPYDPESLNQSRSSVNECHPATVDDNSSVSGGTHFFNSNESVTSSVSTAITDFSATSAGSYYRHKLDAGNALPPIPDVRNSIGSGIANTNAATAGSSTNKLAAATAGSSTNKLAAANTHFKEEQENGDAEEDDELKASFIKSKYYRRVSAQDHYELQNSKGNLSKLNNASPPNSQQPEPSGSGSSSPMSSAAIHGPSSLNGGSHNPLDVIFVEEKKNKKSATSKFLKKLFLKENGGPKTNPLNTAPISSISSGAGAVGLGAGSGGVASLTAGATPASNYPATLKNNNFSDLSFDSADTEATWIENKVDLNRASTISPKEYKLRQKRALENEKYLILEPQKLITGANSNEVLPISKYGAQEAPVSFNKDFKSVDEFTRNLKHLPYISPKTFISNEIAIKYSEDLDKVRACFIFCTEKMHLIESNEIIDVRNSPAKYVNNIFQNKSATIYQLAWLMKVFLDTLKIPNELIIGYYKKPNDYNSNLTTNHVWNSVLINNEWRFIDCGLANIHSFFCPILKNNNDAIVGSSVVPSSTSFASVKPSISSSITGAAREPSSLSSSSIISSSGKASSVSDNAIYFLTKPLELIYTHIPTLIEQQHITPPLDSMIALALPSCYPQFFKTNLRIIKFNNSLTRLQDLEVFEMVVEVPKDIEVFCAVKPDNEVTTNKVNLANENANMSNGGANSTGSLGFKRNSHNNYGQNNNNNAATFSINGNEYKHLCLAQTFWKNNVKFCRIKSTLPKDVSKGFLEIYSGTKGLQKSLTNIHPLSLTIPLYHASTSSSHGANDSPDHGPRRELNFVTRYPTIHCQQHDLYVQEPQIRNLMFNATYIFKIAQHPAMGLTNAAGFMRTKLALQSPTGRIIKLRKKDLQTPFGAWEANVNCSEVGVWKGLVVTDGGVAWCVFAEWFCK